MLKNPQTGLCGNRIHFQYMDYGCCAFQIVRGGNQDKRIISNQFADLDKLIRTQDMAWLKNK